MSAPSPPCAHLQTPCSDPPCCLESQQPSGAHQALSCGPTGAGQVRTQGALGLWTNRGTGRAERGWGLRPVSICKGDVALPAPGRWQPLWVHRGLVCPDRRSEHAEGRGAAYLGPAPGLALPSSSRPYRHRVTTSWRHRTLWVGEGRCHLPRARLHDFTDSHVAWDSPPISDQRNTGVPQQERVWRAPTSLSPEAASGWAGRRPPTHLGQVRPASLVLIVRNGRGQHHLVRDNRGLLGQGCPAAPPGPAMFAPLALAAQPAPPHLPPAGRVHRAQGCQTSRGPGRRNLY